jgi:hypothetical protein
LTRRQEVRLLLVVAFEANTISGPDHRLKQRGRVLGRHHISLGEFTAYIETFVAGSPLAFPISHIVQLPLMLFCQASAPCASLLLHAAARKIAAAAWVAALNFYVFREKSLNASAHNSRKSRRRLLPPL